jgi:PST family polysaccharide transporter
MIGRKVTIGAALMGAGQVTVKFLDLLSTAIIARILMPEDFGIAALGMTTLALMRAFSELPVTAALVREKDVTRTQMDTAFTLNLLRGLLLSGLLLLLARPLSALYDDPRLFDVLCVLAVAPLAQGGYSPALVHFTRALQYKPAVTLEIASKLVGFLVTVALAFTLKNYWAIVCGMAAVPVIHCLMSYMLAPYRPGLSLACARELIGFAGWVTVSSMVSSLNQQGDRFFIGWLLGSAQLGYYSLTGTIANALGPTLVSPLIGPLFAGFSKFNTDNARLRNALLRGEQAIAFLLFPLGAGLGALALPAVEVALGPGWDVTAALLTWLAPAVALQTLSMPIHSLLYATGDTRLIAVREAIYLVLRLVPTVIAAYLGGLLWAVIVRSLISPLLVVVNFYVVRKVIELPVKQQVVNVARPFGAAVILFVCLRTGVNICPLPSEFVLRLGYVAGSVVISAIVYLSAISALWELAGRPDGVEKTAWGLLIKLPKTVRKYI